MTYYKRFFEISFDVMCVCSTTHFIEVNDALCTLLGYSRAEIVNKPFSAFVDPEDLTLLQTNMVKGKVGTFESRYRTKDDRVVWLRWSIHKDVDPDGTMHCVAKDVTEQKVIADQLGTYVIELQAQEREAKQATEEAEMLAYATSHDLQEPLRTILNWASFLQDDYGHLLPEEGQEQLSYILTSAARGRDLVVDLLRLSRVGHGTTFTWVDSEIIVDEAVLDIEFAVRESGAVITRGKLPVVWGDASTLRLVMQNLLGNAIKFTKPGQVPKITVSAEKGDGFWTFSVQDSGIGINPSQHERVFRLFSRLDPKLPGTGIGLTICQKVVSLHGGKIWIESEIDEGVIVRFTVKRLAERHNDETQADTASRGSRTRRKDVGAAPAAYGVSASTPSGLGRLGGTSVLAQGGTLRDRPSRRPGFARSQSPESVGVRGTGRGQK